MVLPIIKIYWRMKRFGKESNVRPGNPVLCSLVNNTAEYSQDSTEN